MGAFVEPGVLAQKHNPPGDCFLGKGNMPRDVYQ